MYLALPILRKMNCMEKYINDFLRLYNPKKTIQLYKTLKYIPLTIYEDMFSLCVYSLILRMFIKLEDFNMEL